MKFLQLPLGTYPASDNSVCHVTFPCRPMSPSFITFHQSFSSDKMISLLLWSFHIQTLVTLPSLTICTIICVSVFYSFPYPSESFLTFTDECCFPSYLWILGTFKIWCFFYELLCNRWNILIKRTPNCIILLLLHNLNYSPWPFIAVWGSLQGNLHYFREISAMDWKLVSPPKFICRNLIPSVMVVGDRACERWLGHEGSTL